MSYLVKLVRDGVPTLLGGDATIEYGEIPDHDTHVKLLRRKNAPPQD